MEEVTHSRLAIITATKYGSTHLFYSLEHCLTDGPEADHAAYRDCIKTCGGYEEVSIRLVPLSRFPSAMSDVAQCKLTVDLAKNRMAAVQRDFESAKARLTLVQAKEQAHDKSP